MKIKHTTSEKKKMLIDKIAMLARSVRQSGLKENNYNKRVEFMFEN